MYGRVSEGGSAEKGERRFIRAVNRLVARSLSAPPSHGFLLSASRSSYLTVSLPRSAECPERRIACAAKAKLITPAWLALPSLGSRQTRNYVSTAWHEPSYRITGPTDEISFSHRAARKSDIACFKRRTEEGREAAGERERINFLRLSHFFIRVRSLYIFTYIRSLYSDDYLLGSSILFRLVIYTGLVILRCYLRFHAFVGFNWRT